MTFPWLFFLSFCSPDSVGIFITILQSQFYSIIFSIFLLFKGIKERGLTHEKTTLFAVFRSFFGLGSWYGLSHRANTAGA
jgi:hypothetical protein